MLSVLSVTLPVFLIIALGYAAVRWGLFSKDETRAMGRLVLNFALPALLFLTLARQPLSAIVNPRYLIAYALGSAIMLLLGVGLFRLRGRDRSTAALAGLGMAGSNSAFVGLPISLQVFGPIASVPVALTMLMENLVVLPLFLALADSGEGAGGRWKSALGSLATFVRNPLLIAIVAGALASLIGLQLPSPLATALDMLARASTPVALFVIGGALVGLRVKGMITDIGSIAAGKLILHPLLVLGFMFLLLPADSMLLHAAVVLAAAPMLSIYPIFGQRYGAEDMTAAALMVTTVASFFTLSLLLWLI
jgi:predicted permease